MQNLFSSVFLDWSWTVGSMIWQFNSQEKREGVKSSQNTNESWETQDFDEWPIVGLAMLAKGNLNKQA